MDRPIRTSYDIGTTLRDLRLRKKMTGVELGARTGISQSRVSKIETGVARIATTEIERILDILEATKTIRQQIFAALELSSLTFEPKYRPIYGPPLAVYKKELSTEHLRCFTMNILPVLLQTSAYHEAILRGWQISQDEFTQRMTETMKRQDLLWDPKHSYHFICHEAALYTIPASHQIQLEQLDRLERMSSLKRVRIGIIPCTAGLPIAEHSNFVLYDTRSILFVITNQELESDDPQDITEHMKIFAELDKKACYDDEARKLLRVAASFME